jgi:hypothetical protein
MGAFLLSGGHFQSTENKTFERPDTWVTDRTGHMGYTFSLLGGSENAVEGVFGDG